MKSIYGKDNKLPETKFKSFYEAEKYINEKQKELIKPKPKKPKKRKPLLKGTKFRFIRTEKGFKRKTDKIRWF